MINTQKSILAKLLATENIEVVHGQFQTAFFDVEKRILGLPLWTQLENVYDLLVGHEVGHALFTPAEGWHDADIEIPGCPRSFLNVVEDIRIEKLIQRKYPGLVSSFVKGYKKLDEDDFFGCSRFAELSPQYVGLIDRINLKAKLRNLVQVQFSADEQPLVDEAFAVETWEDVLAVCAKLYEYAKENAIETPQSPSSTDNKEGITNENADQSDSNGQEEMERSESQTTDNDSGSQNQEAESEEAESQGPSTDEQEVDDQDDNSTGVEATSEGQIESLTDQAYRENEHKLVQRNDNGDVPKIANGFNTKQIDEMIVKYHQIKKSREQHHDLDWQIEKFQKAYDEFLNDNKKVVQIMAKEFEMRKAAWRTKRASTARSGSLDVNKLYAYKYTDDIFKRMTQMPDAKNHGMFMMIDYSGSMQSILGDVIRQTLVLTMFCKKVNIPFQVWGFTTGGDGGKYDKFPMGKTEAPYAHVDHEDVKLMQLLSSSMPKNELEIAFKGLYRTAHYSNHNYYQALSNAEWLGGTPLDEMLIAAPTLLERFTKQNNIQKTNFILLTDGFGGSLNIKRHEKEQEYWGRGYAINVNGRVVRNMVVNGSRQTLTQALLENIRNQVNSVTGYFLAGNRSDFNQGMRYIQTDRFHADRAEFLKNRFITFDNVNGYDRYFILRCDSRSMDTTTEEFEVKENAKKGDITRAFKKHANSKKANRTLAVKFAEMVA